MVSFLRNLTCFFNWKQMQRIKQKFFPFVIADLLGLFAIWVFISGGILYRSVWFNRKVVIEFADFGWFLLPICLLIFFRKNNIVHGSLVLEFFKNSWKKLLFYGHYGQKVKAKQHLIIALMIGFITLCHIIGTLYRYLSFRGDWDLGIYANACANGLFSSFRFDRSLLGDHFETLLILFTPFCRLLDPASTLLVIQSIFFGIGGFGIFILSRNLKWSYPCSLILSVFYLLFAGNMSSLLYDFHLIALSLGFIPWLFWAFYTRKIILFMLMALGYCCLKEITSLTIFGFSLLILIRELNLSKILENKNKIDWSQVVLGVLMTIFSIALFFFVMNIVFPYFRDGQQSMYFEKEYSHLGKSLSEVIANLIFNPLLFLKTVLTYDKLKYIFFLFLPFLFIPLLAPMLLLPAIPAIFVNILSREPALYGGGFLYQCEIYPIFFIATIVILQNRMVNRFHKLRFVWLLYFLIAWSGKSPLWYPSFYRPDQMHIAIREELLQMREKYKDKKVAAIEKIAPHLSKIKYSYLLDGWKKSDVIVIGYPREKHLWQYNYEKIESELIPEVERSGFVKVYEHPIYKSFRVWERSL